VRLFVAIELSESVIRATSALVGELRQRAVRLAPRARLTWAVQERMHVTLVFIGQVSDATAAEARAALEPPLQRAPIPVDVGGLGAFPPRGAPRVLWAGLERGVDALVDLQRDVAERLARIGIREEQRPFRPHVTLARVREPAGLRSAALFEGIAEIGLGAFEVRAVTLFESRLSRNGPAYVALQRTELMAL
jgi:2'-5' RNA ligase